ncbi:hypothetical protein [Streptomyces sp. NRRL F-5123]|uniref:hypothetical protein n=1 Tax=Streptomyces sp. NRRL F-5123 TaxID=1463856 RepID=UPI0004E2134E|nr:hypothetical protein [Streptomyces sp. NRRL F-5123]
MTNRAVTLAVTGHIDLTPPSVPLVRAALDDLLAPYTGPELTGVSCIAAGADSVFAEAVLAVGGRLVVVVPSRDYRTAKVGPEHAPRFDRLLGAAAEVEVMDHATADRRAYETANRALLHRAQRLVAVWNGEPPTGRGGGTADTVQEARALGIPVDVVWPRGASRG